MFEGHQHNDIDRVRDATDLVQIIGEHVALKSRGREYVGLCPFHDDAHPSFAVVTHKGNAFYKCHACGAAGDAFRFMMEYHKMTFGQALRHLAERAGITLSTRRTKKDNNNEGDDAASRLLKANAMAARFFQQIRANPRHGEAARRTLEQRGVGDEAIEAFQLGAAPDRWDGLLLYLREQSADPADFERAGLLKTRQAGDGRYDTFRNRLIFPICDELGRPVAFGGRQLDGDDGGPKYLNSPESPVFDKSSTLYGLHLAKRAIIEQRCAIVTEGYMDVIACHQAGVQNVVATLGTALTAHHARVLKRFCRTVVLLFDGDEAGGRAADRGVEVFFSEPVDVRICVIPDDRDPDDMLREEGGLDRFRALIDHAEDALAYSVRRFRQRVENAGGISARQVELERYLADLARLGFNQMPGVRKQLVINHLSDMLHIPPSVIEESIPAGPRREMNRDARDAPADERAANRSDGSSTTGGSQTNEDADADVHREESDFREMSVPRRLRVAEHDLLAVLIARPEEVAPWLSESANDDEPALTDPATFQDPAAQRLAEVMLPKLMDGRTCSVSACIGELDDRDDRSLLARLFEIGDARCGDTAADARDAWDAARHAHRETVRRQAWESQLSRVRMDETDDDPSQRLHELLESRRQNAYNPVGFMKGAR